MLVSLLVSVVLHAGTVGGWGGVVRRGPWGVHPAGASEPRGGAASMVLQARVLDEEPVPEGQGTTGTTGPVRSRGAVHAPAGGRVAPEPAPDPEAPATPGVQAGDHAGAAPAAGPTLGGGTPSASSGLARPRLPTRVPADFVQALTVSRGAQTGQGRWSWSVVGGRYRSELQAHAEPAPHPMAAPDNPAARASASWSLNWSSQGGLDEHGVAPERFLTQPPRGGARAVNFQRDTGRVTYSGPTGQATLTPGAQDRLSWLAQLLALALAHPNGQGLPSELALWVAGPQGDGGDWFFDVQWHPATQCWQFTRRAERRYDVRVQAWVAVGVGARLVRLEMGHEGSPQPPWLMQDAAQPEACGHAR